jgi:hypothetical protein
MSMSGRLDLSLVEWRALAGVCICLEVYEEGLWADEESCVSATGEREDRLLGRRDARTGEWIAGQLDVLESKGLVKRHGTEPRVRLEGRAAVWAQGLLGFGPDLETAMAAVGLETPANVPGLSRERGGGCGAAAAAGNVQERRRLSVGTSERLNVTLAAAAAAPTSVGANGGDGWRERVQGFVGDADYVKFWGKAEYGWVFEDGLAALERAYRYLKAGVDSGETRIRTTAGRALWNQFRIEQRALMRKGSFTEGREGREGREAREQ